MIERPEDGLLQLELDDLETRCPLCNVRADDLTSFDGTLTCPVLAPDEHDDETRRRCLAHVTTTTELDR